MFPKTAPHVIQCTSCSHAKRQVPSGAFCPHHEIMCALARKACTLPVQSTAQMLSDVRWGLGLRQADTLNPLHCVCMPSHNCMLAQKRCCERPPSAAAH